ncbi:hypothetical protein [Algoriphagus sediminis]|uniref:Glycosyltransferase family 1 protein n=1 Tax=Algoriphagus sediminis TaxID=3057113 RepID=A0ABT7YDX8_9BACT|nr:hypothetical protein [Algoriphagus sediminis]MDN3204728.1 hypothetical protein [Algoriphagus sediminis]
MMEIELLNISNFYSSYYLLALSKVGKIVYRPEPQFEKFNNRGFVIFRFRGKLGVVDNHDPVGVEEELYKTADFYFATNKLLDHPSYDQEKVKPIFPHYPVNIMGLYLRLYGFSLLTKLKPRDLAREIYVLNSRPGYESLPETNYHHGNYVFFSGSTWKKEPWANEIRAQFIRACKANPDIEFEGGFIPRSDGNNFGYDSELNTKKYNPKEFSRLSSRSLISLNNPAVLGAVSWRLAEYWNSSSFVLSFPFKIDLPKVPKDGMEICYITNEKEYPELIERAVKDKDFHERISRGGKSYFENYCTPEAQGKYLLSFFG